MSILNPYFEGLAQRALLLPYCKSCGKPHFYPRHACPLCWGEEYEWKAASGKATVYSYTQVKANAPSRFEGMQPFEIAVVELEEGVRMLTNIVGEGEVGVGAQVRLEFVERDGAVLPAFRLA